VLLRWAELAKGSAGETAWNGQRSDVGNGLALAKLWHTQRVLSTAVAWFSWRAQRHDAHTAAGYPAAACGGRLQEA